jgi:hypothetical protein
VLTTTQQTSLALGVATLGSLFVALSGPTALGARDALVLVLLVMTALSVVIGFLITRLPDPRQAAV